jgi:diguanylate cyclase (GGDEF)-like protein
MPRGFSRVAVVYLIVSFFWMGAIDHGLAVLFPTAFPTISLYNNWAFILLTALIINWVVVRERKRRDAIESELRSLAIRDPLTGLLIRPCFSANLDKAVARAKREAVEVGVIFVDLDGFKAVNDNHGHDIGDKLLCEVASRLHGVSRNSDSVARYGGDEFVLLVDENKGGGTEKVARRILEAVRRPISVQGIEVSITASVGFAVFPMHGDEGEQLVRAADKAMYRVKAAGKNASLEAGSLRAG